MKLRKSLFITIGVFILVAILVNIFLDEPQFDSLDEQAAFEQEANQPELAEKTLFRIIGQDEYNIQSHYEYICTHFEIPEATKNDDREYIYRDDETITNYYDSLSVLDDYDLADIGYYGGGLIAVFLDDYELALAQFSNVGNDSLVYLNNSIGNAYNNLDSVEQAEYYFRKEIEIDGNLDGAYSNLINLLYLNGGTEELHSLLNDSEARKYFPSGIERATYFKDIKPLSYASVLWKSVSASFNTWGFMAAFLILLSWVFYLRKLDIFEVEKWRYIVMTLLLGGLFSFLVYPLTDFNTLVMGFNLNGDVVNDFLYCVIGIGAIEELVKIIPLFIMLRFTKAVNEPFDYIKYASLSALGFAFVENLIYFDSSSLQIIHGRALTAVVFHMFDSSVIAYGMYLIKYNNPRNPIRTFMLFFALACLAHGFYDFWLINETASEFSFITTIFLLVSLIIWNFFKDTTLSKSEFFDANKSVDNAKLQDYLMYSLAGVLLFEYVALALKFSPGVANVGLMSSLYSGTYLILFLSISLSKISIKRPGDQQQA